MWTLWLTLDTTRFHQSGTWWTRRGTSGATKAGQPACEHGGNSPKWTSTCSFALEHAFTLNIKCWVSFLHLKILMFTLSFLGVSGTPNKSATNLNLLSHIRSHQFVRHSLGVPAVPVLFLRSSSFEQTQLTSSARGLRGRDPVVIAESPLFRPGSFSGERHVPRAEFPRAMTDNW